MVSKFDDGVKKMISILETADNSTFTKGEFYLKDGNNQWFCSLGVVAKELGLETDDWFEENVTEFLQEKLNIPVEVTERVIEINDLEPEEHPDACMSYQCVGKAIKAEFLDSGKLEILEAELGEDDEDDYEPDEPPHDKNDLD